MADETKRLKWVRGDKTALAKRSGVHKQYLSDILGGRIQCGRKVAEKLSTAAMDMGLYLTEQDLMFPGESKNPLLKRRVQ